MNNINNRITAIEHDLQVFGSNDRYRLMVWNLRQELKELKAQRNNMRVEKSLNTGVKIGSLIQFKGVSK